MRWWRPSWDEPRTWFVTVRVLEVAAAVVTLGVVLSVVSIWRQLAPTVDVLADDGAPRPMAFPQHVAALVRYGLAFGGTTELVVGALLVLATVVVLHRVPVVGQARLLRWEVAVVGAVQLVVAATIVAAAVFAVFAENPFPAGGEGADLGIVGYQGPNAVEQSIIVGGMPLTALAVLLVAALWWSRLPEEFEEADDPAPALAVDGDTPALPPPPRRSWRPKPAPDANTDDIVLEGVEQIEPVERLQPREAGDGSTGSGYDDWFRRT